MPGHRDITTDITTDRQEVNQTDIDAHRQKDIGDCRLGLHRT